jgi:hypothetical protein
MGDPVRVVMAAIVTALEAMCESGARVYRGRTDDIGDSGTDIYPAFLLRTLSEAPRIPMPATVRALRSIEIRGLLRVPAEDYEDEMDDLCALMYRALAPLTQPDGLPGATGIEITGVEYDHPQPGSEVASVLFNVDVSYVLTLHEGT